MGILARDLLLAAVCYLLPGNILLLLVETRGLRGARRQFIALCVSLIVVPYAFQIVANVHAFLPGIIPLAALCAGGLAAAYLLRRSRRRPILSARVDESSVGRTQGVQDILAWLFIAAFAIVANLPRLHMFLSGASALVVSPGDETYHLAQLTSVARSGIPPRHYFFPQIHLAYYYGSWIYPAILGNVPRMAVSLARAMAIHSTLQTFAFLGLAWLYMRSNLSDWRVRLLGLAFFTFVGGFDYYASLPNINAIEWWQQRAPWLASNMQVSQFVTLYAWVPQHVAGGTAFMAAWLLWKNTDAQSLIKAGLTGALLAFCLSTSPWVFAAFSLATALLVVSSHKAIVSKPARSAAAFGTMAVCFLISAWGLLSIYGGYHGGLTWSNLHVVILERFRGESQRTLLFDRAVTLLGFPLLGAIVLSIEMGLPFLLYLVWWARRFWRGADSRDAFDFTMALLPPLSLLALFVVWSYVGGSNISMRGLVPSQVLVVFGGLTALDESLRSSPPSRGRSLVMWYLIAAFVAAQSVSAVTEIRATSVTAIKALASMLESRSPLTSGLVEQGSPLAWPANLEYMRWIEAHTPKEAIIIEEGCPAPEDDVRYRWLERIRVLSVGCARSLALFERDWDFILPTEWASLKDHPQAETSALALYQAPDFPMKDSPAFLVVWQGASAPSGFEDTVYSDPYVTIYRVP